MAHPFFAHPNKFDIQRWFHYMLFYHMGLFQYIKKCVKKSLREFSQLLCTKTNFATTEESTY